MSAPSHDGVKRYSIFLVQRETPSVEILPGENMDFLRPAGHCSLRLDGLVVGGWTPCLSGTAGRGLSYPCQTDTRP